MCVGAVILAHCSVGRCSEAFLSVTTFHRLEIFIEALILILHNEGGLHPERSGRLLSHLAHASELLSLILTDLKKLFAETFEHDARRSCLWLFRSLLRLSETFGYDRLHFTTLIIPMLLEV